MAVAGPTWIVLSLVSAVAFAGHSVVLKQSVRHADVVLSTVVFRAIAGALLLAVVLAAGEWPAATPAFWRTLALVVAPEVGGMLFLGLALRSGDLSIVQPILGIIPVLVTAGGVVALREIPSATAGAGIALVAAGVYCVGVEGRGSLLAPLRALGRSRASWYAVATALCWSVTTVIHKFGIAEVGALPWSVAVTLASAAALAVVRPLLPGTRTPPAPERARGAWSGLMLATGLLFALHMLAIQTGLGLAPAGYVIGLASTSTLIATLLGILVLRERAGSVNRVAGAVLVTCGAVLIAALG